MHMWKRIRRALSPRPLIAVASGLALAGIAACSASADWLYSIDLDCNVVVRIDDQTGDVRTLSELSEMPDSVGAMALHKDTLYILSYDYGVQTRLLAIDPLSGLVISDVEVRNGGAAVLFAEGLVSTGVDLVIAFHTSASGPFDSDAIGILDLDGTIIGGVSLDPNLDMDELTYDPVGGAIISYDGVTSVSSDLYTVSAAPPGFVFQGTIFGGAYVPVNIEVSTGALSALDGTMDQLHRIDLVTRDTIETLPLSRSGNYRGLANSERAWNCDADIDDSGEVSTPDLLIVLASWGPGGCMGFGDINSSGAVDIEDLLALLAAWGPCK